jgi:two-component system chemotaxis family response regulator WspR
MAANIELLRLSNMDGLTGLNNRRRFDEYALAEWRRARRERAPFGLLLIDVDQFKTYNDAHGHLAGDELLKQIGEAICSCCRRPEDLPSRYGGDEFAILLPGIQPSALAAVGERLRHAVEDLKIERGSGSSQYVTLSIGGAATIPTQEDGLMDLIAIADRNLFEAKAKGRNQSVVHE